jgi:hypothetical protein
METKQEPNVIEVIAREVRALRRKNRDEQLDTFELIVMYLDHVRQEARKGLAEELLAAPNLKAALNGVINEE